MAHFVTEPVLFVIAQTLAATVNLPSFSMKYANVGSIQLNWTGTPTGTFSLQGSSDNVNFVSLVMSAAITAAGSADQALIDILDTGIAWIRIAYTRTSGTGALNMYINYKQS